VVKFLSGGQRDGERIPLCTYWRNDLTADPDEDFARLIGTGEEFAQEGVETQRRAIGDFSGQCIANAFFKREAITCFNNGRCDEEGKCLPCTKYTYGGTRLAISHSPPVDILKNFDKGLTDADLRSPNLVRFPPSVINLVDQDQLPYHIIIRNIQAVIDKCCHWNIGDGLPDEFFLAQIIAGPDSFELTGENQFGSLAGIIVTHPEFPDTVGTFFPVGTVVVAGFKDQPSFYLEPRTGLFKPGEGVIFAEGLGNSPSGKAKNLAVQATPIIITSVDAAGFAQQTATDVLNQAQEFFNLADATNDSGTIETAQVRLDDATEKAEAATEAAQEAATLGQAANDLVGTVTNADPGKDTFDATNALATTLFALAETLEISALNSGGGGSSQTAAAEASKLRTIARDLEFVALGAETKCEFAFTEGNIAKQWNLPEDGTLICNGVRTDCDFYTGGKWLLATDEKMDLGQPITGDQLQEVRVRSDDFTRFPDPAEEFENRFSTPFIWAFKGYTEVVGEPELEDMELYRPKLLFGRGTGEAEFETILLDKITVTNFADFEVDKGEARVQPGSETVNTDQPPQFPNIISNPTVPTSTRLEITHPQSTTFDYQTWSPDKNKISLFGTATSDAVLYVVNNTALKNRQRYHNFLGTRNFVPEFPLALPGTPSFTGIFSFELLEIFRKLEDEQILNPSTAPLGFAKISTDREGFWQTIAQVDLVHNAINDIFVFLLIDDFWIYF